jgi:hypothetical protein
MIQFFNSGLFSNNFKHCLPLLCLIFTLTTPDDAGTYEGTIGISHVWMDIDIKGQDGKIQGSYFYLKSGAGIRLEGKKTGDSISLSEYDESGKASGRFQCVKKEKEIEGEWTSSDNQKKLAVILKESDPKKMKDIQRNTLLDEKDQEILESEFPEDQCNTPAIAYDYKDSYIRSFTISSRST